jgi:long-subunit acyl-CoA synthetase (AMP-forming)
LWKKYIDDGMAVTNSITLSNSQKVLKWVWLPHNFSEQTEELNALLKIKRKFIRQKYSDLIESIYSEPQNQVTSSVVLI